MAIVAFRVGVRVRVRLGLGLGYVLGSRLVVFKVGCRARVGFRVRVGVRVSVGDLWITKSPLAL